MGRSLSARLGRPVGDLRRHPGLPILGRKSIAGAEERRRLVRFGLMATTIILLLFAALEVGFLFTTKGRPDITLGLDFNIYMERTRAWLAGLVWTWPAAWALLKPTLGPFALLGMHRRAWWIGWGRARDRDHPLPPGPLVRRFGRSRRARHGL